MLQQTEAELHGRLAELKRTLHALLPERSPAGPASEARETTI